MPAVLDHANWDFATCGCEVLLWYALVAPGSGWDVYFCAQPILSAHSSTSNLHTSQNVPHRSRLGFTRMDNGVW